MPKQQGFQELDTDTQSISGAVREDIDEIREPSNVRDNFAKFSKSSSELAAHFGCTKEAIQDWYKFITQAYCWLPATEFKSGIGKNTRYSPLCIEKIINLKISREAGLTASEWITTIHQENVDLIANWKASQLPKQVLQVEQSVNPPQVTGGLMSLPNLFL
jgi:hypothetical protein